MDFANWVAVSRLARNEVMGPRLPPPPAGSCFVADLDDEGQYLLSWRSPESSPWVAVVFFGVWLCIWVPGGAVQLWRFILDARAGFPGGGWPAHLREGLWLCGWALGTIMVGRVLLLAAFRGQKPERLTFGPFALRYEGN